MARPNFAIKLVAIISGTFLSTLCLAISACDYTETASGQAHSLPSGISGYQKEKQKIIDDFYENSRDAISIYKNKWKRSQAERAKTTSTGPTVVWLAMAGGLIEVDVGNYDEYYSYIVQNIESSDWEVAATAVNSLRGARGHESIDSIVRMIRDEREMVSADAVLAIDYRLKTSLYNSSLKSDYEYAMKKMKDICQNHLSVRRLEKVCKENEI